MLKGTLWKKKTNIPSVLVSTLSTKKVVFIAPFGNLSIIGFSILLAAVSHTNLVIHDDVSFRELLTKRGK